jgi:hypothetical protein
VYIDGTVFLSVLLNSSLVCMINRSLIIGAGIVFFDDEKGLQRCISSIQASVDLITTIDGKFKDFEDDHCLSNDNSIKVVESFPNAVYYCSSLFREKFL